YNKEFTIGMCLMIPIENFVKYFDTPTSGKGIVYTWCTQLKLDAHNELKYNVLASWEQQNQAFLSRDFFVKTMKYEALKQSKPVQVVIK
ncbi:DUF4861 family protein, partial [bacterium]|nr:DUF4861 family protein [bacterium]